MNEIIRKRKSIRQYDFTALDDVEIDEVRAKISSVKPLYPNIRYSIEIQNKAKGLFTVKAPNYLIFCSEEDQGAYENIGFIGQQLDLFFSGSGFGSCWLGMAKPGEKEVSALPHVICMAFGKPAEPLHRDISEFKRKPLSDICVGDDARLEAARLAPSGMNSQNWYFIAENGMIHCYRKKLNPVSGIMLNKMGCIDMGISICHIAEDGGSFSFEKKTDAPVRKGCVYMGTVINC